MCEANSRIGRGGVISYIIVVRLAATLGIAMPMAACVSIGGKQQPVTKADLQTHVCPSDDEIIQFDDLAMGSKRAQTRDDTVLKCVKAIDAKYDEFTSALQAEGVTSNLFPDIFALVLGGGAALTKGQTAKQFTQGSLAAAGIGAAIDKDVFYKQTLPAIEASMNAKRYLILKTIIESEKNDPDGSMYTLDNAGFDLDTYQAAGDIYVAIGELTATANNVAENAKEQLTKSQNEPYLASLLSQDVQTRVKALTDKINAAFPCPIGAEVLNATDQQKMNNLADTLKVSRTDGEGCRDERGAIRDEIVRRVHSASEAATEIATLETQLAPFLTPKSQ